MMENLSQETFGQSIAWKKVLEAVPFLIAFSFPFPLRVTSILMGVAIALFGFFAIKNGRPSVKLFKEPLVQIIALQVLIVLLGMIYSTDLAQGARELERTAFLPAILLLVILWQKYDIRTSRLFFGLLTGGICAIVYIFVYVFFFLDPDSRHDVLTFRHDHFTDIIGIHPTYLSAYFITLVFFLMERLRLNAQQERNINKRLSVVLLVFIVVMLIFIRSQIGLMIFFTASVIYAVVLLKKRARVVTFVLFTAMFVVFLMDRHRVSTFMDSYGKNVSSALDQRFLIWRGTLVGIKSSPFLGAGTGGEQLLINRGYEQTGYLEGIEKAYNAHNQYLQYLTRNGVVELLVFLLLLVYAFYKSLKSNQHIFLMFNITLVLMMFAESFLSVQRGIVFFYFFLCAFILLDQKSEENAVETVR